MVELLKIAIVFSVMIALTYKRISLWISLLVATILLGFFFRLSIIKIGTDLISSSLDAKTLFLVGSFVAIIFFSNLLKEAGRLDEILEGFKHILKDIRVVIALLPAIIGLMPIVGGALVSAPMVVSGCDELKLSPERRTFINYWFRHLWEYILPTYPALVLAATLVDVPLRKFCWVNLPLTPTAIFGGIFVGYWGVSKTKGGEPLSLNTSGWRLFQNLFFLLFALVLVVAFQVELVYAFGGAILGMILFYRIGRQKVLKAFKESISIELLLSVVVVMGFKKVLESSQAIPLVAATLSSSGIPKWIIAMFVPMLVGVMTGVTIAPIGIGFPILIPLLQNDPRYLNYMMLAFASGIGGVLLSPLHLCLVLTKEYFRADWDGIYRLIWFPVASLLIVGLLMTFFAPTY